MGLKLVGDLFIAPIYLCFIYFFFLKFYNKKIENRLDRRIHLWGFNLKIFGAICFGLIYQFYYGFGDTFNYANGARIFWDVFWDSPLKIFDLLATSYDDLIPTDSPLIRSRYFRMQDEEGVIMQKICGVLGLISFRSYLVIAFWFVLFSFSGLWRIYLIFTNYYPELRKQFGFALFFIPSVFFWGSGVLKDTICLGAIGWLFYAVYSIVVLKKSLLKNILFILIFSTLIFRLKAYILIAFIPGLFLWMRAKFLDKYKNKGVRLLFGFVFGILLVAAGFVLIQKLPEIAAGYALDNIEQTVKGFHSDHGGRESGSTYTLGHIEYTLSGLVKVIPQAVNVSLYRPYFWEANNPVMLLSAIESFAFLIFSIFILFQTKFSVVLRNLFSNADVLLCFIYTFILGFAVGFTSFNFGALVRFKIPFIPFFLIGLFILNHLHKVRKLNRRNQKLARLKEIQG